MKHNNFTLLPLTLAAMALALIGGCTPMRFSEFSGRGKSWPVAPDAMAEKQFAVPVYRGWPERPYQVIGSIRFEDPHKYWDDGIIGMAASMAKKKAGDAIVMRYGSEYGVGMTTGAVGDPKVVSMSQITALVIKWKSQSDLAAEKASVERFVSGFKQRHPELMVKRELVDLATEYVRWLGLALESETAAQQLDEVLTQVLNSKTDEKSSKWLFKGNVKASSLTASSSDVVFGVATVNRNQDTLTIVSSSEKAELNFSGTLKDGRVSGQFGFSAGPTIISAKAEGVFTEQKISLTGQGQTPDGTFQGSFSFSR